MAMPTRVPRISVVLGLRPTFVSSGFLCKRVAFGVYTLLGLFLRCFS